MSKQDERLIEAYQFAYTALQQARKLYKEGKIEDELFVVAKIHFTRAVEKLPKNCEPEEFE